MNYRQNMSPRCPMPSGQTTSCPSCTRPVQDSCPPYTRPMPEPRPSCTRPMQDSCSPCTRPMPENPSPCEDMCGYPIAMAYVPAQVFNTTYDLNRALEVGTIFPELHKPFCGKRCVR